MHVLTFVFFKLNVITVPKKARLRANLHLHLFTPGSSSTQSVANISSTDLGRLSMDFAWVFQRSKVLHTDGISFTWSIKHNEQSIQVTIVGENFKFLLDVVRSVQKLNPCVKLLPFGFEKDLELIDFWCEGPVVHGSSLHVSSFGFLRNSLTCTGKRFDSVGYSCGKRHGVRSGVEYFNVGHLVTSSDEGLDRVFPSVFTVAVDLDWGPVWSYPQFNISVDWTAIGLHSNLYHFTGWVGHTPGVTGGSFDLFDWGDLVHVPICGFGGNSWADSGELSGGWSGCCIWCHGEGVSCGKCREYKEASEFHVGGC